MISAAWLLGGFFLGVLLRDFADAVAEDVRNRQDDMRD